MHRLFIAKSIIAFVIALITVVFVASAQQRSPKSLADTSWPMYQHDAAHTGRSPNLGISSSPQVLWKKQLALTNLGGESGTGMTMGHDGIVYTSILGHLIALYPQDGTIKWDISGGSSRSTPAIADDGTIYWGFSDSFAAVTPAGQVAWAWENLSGNYVFGSSPVISDDGTIYVTHDGLWSFTSTGALRWAFSYGWFHHSSPTIGPDGSIYTSAGAHAPNGTLKWYWPAASVYSTFEAPTVGADGTIYLGAGHAKLFTFNPDGSTKWVFETDETQDFYDSMACCVSIGYDGTIYFGISGIASYAHVYAVNPNGTLKWKYPIPRGDNLNARVAAPIVIDKLNRVFTCADNGSCYGFAPDGTLLWEYVASPNAWNRTAPLIFSNGTILILDGTGALHCLADPAVPRLDISPSSLLASIDYGTSTFTSTLQLTSTLSPISWTATLTPTTDWITVPVITGTTPSALQIVIEPNDLVTGTYTANLMVLPTTENAANAPMYIPIKVLIGFHRLYLPIISK